MGSFSMFLPAFSVIRSLLHSCDGGKMVCHVSGFSWEWGWTFHTFICNSFSSSLKRLFVSLPVFFCPPPPRPPCLWLLVLLISSTLYTSNSNPFWDYVCSKSSSKFQVYAFVFLLVLASHKLSFTFMYSWISIIVFWPMSYFQRLFCLSIRKSNLFISFSL